MIQKDYEETKMKTMLIYNYVFMAHGYLTPFLILRHDLCLSSLCLCHSKMAMAEEKYYVPSAKLTKTDMDNIHTIYFPYRKS